MNSFKAKVLFTFSFTVIYLFSESLIEDNVYWVIKNLNTAFASLALYKMSEQRHSKQNTKTTLNLLWKHFSIVRTYFMFHLAWGLAV